MKAKWIHKIFKTGTSLAVALPPALLEFSGLQRGDAVTISLLSQDKLIIQSLDSYLASLPPNSKDKSIIKI